jgi:hypothetical protein
MADEKPESYLLIVFEGINSVNIKTLTSEGVSPLQLMAIASYLEILGKNQVVTQINEKLEQQRQQNLSVPKQQLIIPGGK